MSGYHKNEIYAFLNEKGIPYEAVEHEALTAASAKISSFATPRESSTFS